MSEIVIYEDPNAPNPVQVRLDGKIYQVEHYNLDVIIHALT
jgi:hypothetical protein